jgi:hypothetical protein
MALWKNITRLASGPAVQGVVNPGPVDVLTPYQAVQIADDATRATAPPRVPEILWTNTPVTAVGEHTGLELLAFGAGLWLEEAQVSVPFSIWRDDAQVIASRIPANLVQWGLTETVAQPLSRANNVQIAAAEFPAATALAAITSSASYPWHPLHVFIPPGQRAYFAHAIANVGINVRVKCREVPIQPR